MRACTGYVIIGVTTLRNHGGIPVPAVPSWLLEPLWDQFSALLPGRPVYDPSHPLGCHRPRISDRLIFEKLIQVLRFGCSYAAIADCACGATTIRERRDEWIKAGVFAALKKIARDACDRMVGLVLEELAVDGCIAKAPGGGELAGRSPVDRGKLGYKRSIMVDGRGIPLGRVLAPANRHDSPLLAPTLDKLEETGPLPEGITVHLDAAGLTGREWTTRELRQSFVSLLSDEKVVVEVISRLVGHLSTMVTETVYRKELRQWSRAAPMS